MKMFGWLVPVMALIGFDAMGAEDTCQKDGGPAYCVNAESSPYDYQVSDGYSIGQAGDAATAIAKYRADYLANLARSRVTVCSLTIDDDLLPEITVPAGRGHAQSGDYSQALSTGTGSYWSLDWSYSQETQSSRVPLTVTLVSHTSLPACANTRRHGAYLYRIRQVACPDDGLYNTNSSGIPASYCWRPATWRDPMKAMGPQCPSTPNPANIATGNKFHTESDYAGPGSYPLQFVRYYNNRLWRDGLPHTRGFWSNLGPNWRSNYDRAIRHEVSVIQSTVYAFRPDGRRLFFHQVGGQFVPDGDIADRLARLVDGGGSTTGWKYTVAVSEEVETYDANGRLISISNRAGLTQALAYDTSGRLISVTDSFGHQLQFGYNTASQLQTMTDPNGQVITYAYNSVGNVNQVSYPDTSSRTYLYGESAHTGGVNSPYAMTGIQDESAIRFATYKYDYSQRVVSTEHAGGVNKYSLAYGSGSTTVTDPLNTARNYAFTNVQGVGKNTSMSQPCTFGCGGGSAAATTYDANANVASRADFRGNKTCFAYDVSRNLETERLEGLASTLSCPTNLSTYAPTSGTRERKISTQWHSTFRLPTQIDEPGKRTTFSHDANGNVLTKTETDTALSLSRTWTYTYSTFGRVLTADGPRTDASDVTTYTYYSCTTGYQCGQVHTITNAAGHVTTYSAYNAHGQPLTITDANGVQTTLTYDLRQRLTSRTVGTESTTFDYWPTGLLKKVTLPDATYLQYTYDAAHRLTDITDSEGNRIHYTLDNMGNRTGEQAYDPSNALTRTRTRVFDTLNRLQKDIGAAGTAAVTTTYGYDNNGNQTSIVAPLGRDTTQGYDELNRLSSVTDPLNGVTQYGYNALDQLISVTDPRGLQTSYSYDALGDLKQQTSPDTGVTNNTYDSGGNLATSTDARSAITTYTYDALNRVTTAAFTVGATTDQTLTYTYDAGTYGKGKLTGVSDSNHSLAWTYDDQGRVLTANQTVGSVSKTTSYAYANGLRQSMTTPSGQLITYSYTNGKVTGISVNGTVLVSNILYDPFGPVRQWTWSNGSLSVRTFDQDGKVAQIDSAGLKTYSYDDAFRITGITDTTDATLSWTYGYDDLDRLTSASKTGTTLGYTYDANGNRLSQTGSAASTFTIASNSNRLTSTSGALARTYGYDNAGNATSYTDVSFTYNNRGRMSSSTKSGVTTNYTYNALGQLIKKGTSTLYYYDEAGHIIGIYDGSGALTEEIVWLGDTPIVSLRPKVGGGINIYNIHTDHLNTPRLIVGSINPGERWRWDADPFGGGTVNNNPSGVGVFNFDLRFPGQTAMAETGLNYNYYRDYDPATGRYIQSDPIGLEGGINTYAYANGDPVRNSDPLGLEVGAAFGSINRHTAKWPEASSSSCERCECWLTCLREDPLLPELLIGLGGPIANIKGPGERRPGASPWTSVDRRLPPWTGANPNAGATVTRGTIQRVKCVGRYGTVAAAVGAFTAGYAVGAAGRCWVECL